MNLPNSRAQHYVLAADAKIAWGLAAAVGSILQWGAPGAIITVIDGGLPGRIRRRLESSARQTGIQLRFISHEVPPRQGLQTMNGSLFTYARLFIEQFVDADFCLYLDADTVLVGDPAPLFAQARAEPEVALWAVCDVHMDECIKTIRKFLRADTTLYCNTGVLLINMSEWKRLKVKERALDLCAAHSSLYWDQGPLNIIFEGRWRQLPSIYNHMVVSGEPADVRPLSPDVVVFHFIGLDKPWGYLCARSTLGPFTTALARAGWPGWNPRFELRPWIRKSPLRNSLAQLQYTLRKLLGMKGLRDEHWSVK